MHTAQENDARGVPAVEVHMPSFKFFINPSCEFFPCHKNSEVESFNCLFCYCPLYSGECPGEYVERLINGNKLKDCTGCGFPHRADNYDDMIRCLIERIS